MRNIFFSLVILLGFICELPAQEVSAQTQAETGNSYIIREDDILTITVRNEPEYTVNARPVRIDGKIAFPMLGEINVSGKTTLELEEYITEQLAVFVKEPMVQVFVDKVASYWVTLAGEVGKPGRYAIGSSSSGSSTTVLDILAAAGGPLPTAKSKNIIIVRNTNGVDVQYKFNYKDVLKGKNFHQNIVLENRDKILVP